MRKTIIVLLLGLFTAAGLSAVPADVTYAEGQASIRFRNGSQREAGIGDRMNTGDTLKTGTDGLVELDQKGVRLNIASNTVFTLMEKETGGKTAGVFSLVLGSMKFRYKRITGQEPLIQTNSCVAGVRGTEFSVFAGADGSALIFVDRGEVTVEAAGRSVALEPDEGVEVRPGQPPGNKFKVQRDQVDYSKWNDEKLVLMLQDPVSALTSISERLEAYIRDIEEYWALYREYKARLDAERQTMVDISIKQGKEQARRYNLETVMPLAAQTGNLFLNVRYFTLAAFSLRRFVGGRLYLFLKGRSFAQAEEPLYREFLDRYDRLLDTYEGSIVPHLVEADI
jgi:hypothetical protein